MNFKFAFCPIILLLSASLSFAQNVNVVIHGAASIAKIDDNFVCVTLDWWPAEKCDYNQCPWGKAGILNLESSTHILSNLQGSEPALNPLRIKVGGSLQDNVVYKVGEVRSCPNFMKREDDLFGFSQGCLSMERWDQLNRFFKHIGVKLTFGLNALFGRNESQTEKGLWIGDWKPQNTRDFMKYTISKGYKVDSYEFGNQLSGSRMGAKVDAKQYGKDVIVLKNLVKELYAHPDTEPKVLGPGGSSSMFIYIRLKVLTLYWYGYFLNAIDACAGDDPNMMNKVLDPSCLNQVSQTYKGVSDVVNKFRPQFGAWVSESGGALKGGSKDVSRTFADGFWYLDQMGMASTYDQKVFCRQALIGGNYGLLNATTFVPNPDYYGALLWHRLMGSTVLAVTKESDPNLRVYAHCAKKKPGVSLIFINLSKDRSFNITLSNAKPGDAGKPNYEFVGKQNREEFRDIPAMDPKLVDASTPISIAAQSIAYVTIRDFEAPACV
ncbi:glucuronidase 1 [Hibiscus trionum]|uniref:Glucuronidase 1 n=1 Tax=Hibiscus trionum TaxID=183268 RepID=A0A9W7GR17_HIBTR|nr:glucuronidase 1 [Hibiscus trionum]